MSIHRLYDVQYNNIVLLGMIKMRFILVSPTHFLLSLPPRQGMTSLCNAWTSNSVINKNIGVIGSYKGVTSFMGSWLI